MLLTLSRPYWFDEAQTLYYIRQPFTRMLVFIAHDFCPPLYHLILRAWVNIFSDGEISTAILSLLFAAAAVWLTYRFTLRLFDRRVARMAAILFSASYSVLWYSQETRMYTMMMALALASTLFLHALLVRPGRWEWIGYFAATVAGVYTHYPFWFLVFAQNLIVIWYVHSRKTKLSFPKWVGGQLVLILAYLPWAPFLYNRVVHWYLPGMTVLDLYPVSLPWGPLYNLVGTVFSPFTLAWNDGNFISEIKMILGALVLIALASLFIKYQFRDRTLQITFRRQVDWTPVIFLVLLVATPLVILTLLGVSFIRYVIYVTPFFCCLLAYGISQMSSSKIQKSFFITFLFGAVACNSYFFVIQARLYPPNEYIDHWPRVAQYIQNREIPGQEMILFVFQDHEAIFRYYYHGRLPVIGFLPDALQETGDHEVDRIRWISRPGITQENAAQVASYVSDYQAIWLPGPDIQFLYDSDRWTWKWFEEHCVRTDKVTFNLQSPLHLYRYTQCRTKTDHTWAMQ